MKASNAVFMGVLGCLAAGCATVASLPTNTTAEKTAITICATAGSAAKAIHAAAPQLDSEAHEYLIMFRPYCNQSTPTAAMTSAEQAGYEGLLKLAAPYMEGVK